MILNHSFIFFTYFIQGAYPSSHRVSGGVRPWAGCQYVAVLTQRQACVWTVGRHMQKSSSLDSLP